MTLLPWIAVVTLALVFGSFLNVCITRLPGHRSIVLPRSECPHCRRPVRPRDNIPVFSWLLLRGRCRDCGRPISLRYPLVESGYAALVAGCVVRFGFTWEGTAGAVFCFLALGLLVMDFETMLLPDTFTLTGLALGLVFAFARGAIERVPFDPAVFHGTFSALGAAALAAAAWGLLMLGIRWSYYLVRRRHGLGLGDVKLVAMLAAWLGSEAMALCFLLAVLGATLVGISAAGGRAFRPRRAGITNAGWGTMRLPLGVFLCASALWSLFFGAPLLKWYFNLFL